MTSLEAHAQRINRHLDVPWANDVTLAAQLRQAFSDACNRWQDIIITEAEFAARIESIVETAPEVQNLQSIRPTEQYLVAACLLGRPGAAQSLEHHAFGALDLVARRFAGSIAAEDLVQRVRERLLVENDEAGARLSMFSGQTSLERWIRLIGLRIGLDATRSAQRRTARERALPDSLAQRDPEFYWMRQLYTEDFERILTQSLAALPTRERNVLRGQVVHGMSLDAMARMWGVHRATVARWLRSGRVHLLDSVRDGLRTEAGLSDSEVDSVLDLIRSGVSEGVIARGLRSSTLQPPIET